MLSRFNGYIERNGFDAKPHQTEGVQWLLDIEQTGEQLGSQTIKSGILADEMGLGKTIQMLGLTVANPKRNTLIVLPPALLHQWKEVIETLLPVKPLVFHGVDKKTVTLGDLKSAPYVITTYGMISVKQIPVADDPEQLREIGSILSEVSWGRIIYDEAHHLRNASTRKHRGSLTLTSEATWLVTGTPIQNSLRDFHSLCAVLRIPKEVVSTCEGIKTVVTDMFLRRTKKSVGLKMPDIHTTNITVAWEDEHEMRLAQNIHSLVSFTAPTAGNIDNLVKMLGQSHLPILMRMRQVCIYPDLIREVVNRYVKDDGIDKASLHESTMPGLDGKSKLNAVLHKVLERKDNGRAKLIFSHFRREIDWLCESFAKSGLKCAYIDGRINHKERADIMKSTDYHVVVLQIRTACEGLNLQQFKEVYFTSPHWNPFVEDQAVARSHRFGQTEDVDVFRFEMEAFEDGKTLDGYCRMVQEKKRELSKDLLG